MAETLYDPRNISPNNLSQSENDSLDALNFQLSLIRGLTERRQVIRRLKAKINWLILLKTAGVTITSVGTVQELWRNMRQTQRYQFGDNARDTIHAILRPAAEMELNTLRLLYNRVSAL
jgi:hypothetical protein